MKGIRFLFLSVFLVWLQNISAAEVTVTLQNGLNEYTGCDDASITTFEPAVNYGAADRFIVEYQEVKIESC